MVLRQGGDLAQVETFWSPQKGPGNCTRPLPLASRAEILAVRAVLGAWRPTTQTAVVSVCWQGQCCMCLKTHAYAQEEEEGLFKADAVNEEDPERDRATQV